MKLNTPKDKVLKTFYNLDELRDLESKLVLITGSKAENRTEVDHYLNVSSLLIYYPTYHKVTLLLISIPIICESVKCWSHIIFLACDTSQCIKH